MTNRRNFFKTMAGVAAAPTVAVAEPSDRYRDMVARVARRASHCLANSASPRMTCLTFEVGPSRGHDTVNIPLPTKVWMVDKTGPRAQVAGVRLGNYQIVLDKHIEVTMGLPDLDKLVEHEELLEMYLRPGFIALAERLAMDAPRGPFLFAPLRDEIVPGGITAESRRSGIIIRASLDRKKAATLTLDMLYGQASNETTVTINAMDAKSFVENSGLIADAIQKELRQNHPLLGTLRAVV